MSAALGPTTRAWVFVRQFDPRWALHRLRGRNKRAPTGGSAERWDEKYAETPDMFRLDAPGRERRRYEFLLAALGDRPLEKTLELGCSVGVLTAMLAERTSSLVATDISQVVLGSAQQRLQEAGHGEVEFVRAELPDGVPAGPFDTVVASEVLCYMPADAVAESGVRMAQALAPGGRLLVSHTRGYFPEHAISSDHAARLVARAPGLRRVRSWGGGELRVDLFTKRA